MDPENQSSLTRMAPGTAGHENQSPLGNFAGDARKQLALLYLFQGYVDVDVLRYMGDPRDSWCLPELRGLTREHGIALLDRAAAAGLLTTRGEGMYSFHPDLPAILKPIYEQHYAANRQATVRSFVQTFGSIGNSCHTAYSQGNQSMIDSLRADEPNLLHARALARQNGWWELVITNMQGLKILYQHFERWPEWAALLEEIVPDFTDPGNGGPLQGRELPWRFLNQYRVEVAVRGRNWAEAARLQQAEVAVCIKSADPYLKLAPAELDENGRNEIRDLVLSLQGLAQFHLNAGDPACVKESETALQLCQRIGDIETAHALLLGLGIAYKDIPAVRNLATAEHWHKENLQLFRENDHPRRAMALGELGGVAYSRFTEARAAGRPEAEARDHLDRAAAYYEGSIAEMPPDAPAVALVHNQLGAIYGQTGDVDRAMRHLEASLEVSAQRGELLAAAKTHFNAAVVLAGAKRFDRAHEHAQAALRGYETCKESAEAANTAKFLAELERALRA